MNKAYLTLATLLTAAATLTSSEAAHALGPVDVEIAARGGFATNPSSTDFSANPFGGGIGGRAGVSYFGFYGGLSGIYYFGSSGLVNNSLTLITAPLHTFMAGVELGYTLPIPYVKLRPQVGVGSSTITFGPFTSSGTPSVGGGAQSYSNLYLEPGIVVLVPLGRFFFVGADLNALFLPSATGANGMSNNTPAPYVSLSTHAQVGIQF